MSHRLIDQLVGPGTKHTNTTTENKIARHTFAAGDLQPGKKFVIDGGASAPSSNSTDTCTMALRFGTTSATPASNTLIGTSAAVDTANDDVAAFHCELDVQSATRAVAHGWLSDLDASGSKLTYEFVKVLTIDNTVVNYFDWTAGWSVAHADNQVEAESFTVVEAVT